MDGVDLPPGIKDNSVKGIKIRKGIVNTMDNSTGNSNSGGSGGNNNSGGSGGNNNSGGSGGNNGGQSSSAGGTGSSSYYQGTGSASDIRVRPVTAMSLTQMSNPLIEEIVEIIHPLDNESLTRVQQVLTDERDAYQNNNPDHKTRVQFKHLGYSFRNKNESGSVISELMILKKTDPYFSKLDGSTNVDKLIYYKGN
jgi:hypothetical protein